MDENRIATATKPTMGVVINVSNQQFRASKESVLNKGHNFATTIRWAAYVDMIAPEEEPALKIPKVQADELS